MPPFCMNIRSLTLIIFLVLVLSACIPAAEPILANETKTIPDATSLAPAQDHWRPIPGLSWQWVLTGKLDLDLQTDVIDVDLGVGKSVVDHYHKQGTKVICYISVGS